MLDTVYDHPAYLNLLSSILHLRDRMAAGGTVEEAHQGLDAILADVKCPNDGPVEPCPDCGQPWWTVQRRCGCFPKPGTLEAENEELKAALRHYSGKSVKLALSHFEKLPKLGGGSG